MLVSKIFIIHLCGCGLTPLEFICLRGHFENTDSSKRKPIMPHHLVESGKGGRENGSFGLHSGAVRLAPARSRAADMNEEKQWPI